MFDTFKRLIPKVFGIPEVLIGGAESAYRPEGLDFDNRDVKKAIKKTDGIWLNLGIDDYDDIAVRLLLHEYDSKRDTDVDYFSRYNTPTALAEIRFNGSMFPGCCGYFIMSDLQKILNTRKTMPSFFTFERSIELMEKVARKHNYGMMFYTSIPRQKDIRKALSARNFEVMKRRKSPRTGRIITLHAKVI